MRPKDSPTSSDSGSSDASATVTIADPTTAAVGEKPNEKDDSPCRPKKKKKRASLEGKEAESTILNLMEILKDKQQKQSLKNGSSPNSFFPWLFMKCLLWKSFTLLYIPNLRNRRYYRKRNQIIDLLQIQLQAVEHRLQPTWELHCHHYPHHHYRRQHLHQIRPLE